MANEISTPQDHDFTTASAESVPSIPVAVTPPSSSDNSASSVQVAVRVRPLLAFEAGNDSCVQVLNSHDDSHHNAVRIGGQSGPRFTFDQVFDAHTSQAQLYQGCVAPLVESCFEGYNATVLAYGQTGSGKTYTMMGRSPSSTIQGDETAGVIPHAVSALFGMLEKRKESQTNCDDYDYQVSVQFLELYGEEIRDLLTGKPSEEKLTIRDLGNDEPEVVGATELPVSSAEETLGCMRQGVLRRVTGATAMNESSSRSHALLSLLVEQTIVLEIDPNEGGTSPSNNRRDGRRVQVKRSKFNFVDLAGSERQKRTKAEGKRLREGIDINKGLLVLGNVISALGDPRKRGKTFVPYRDSKLTQLLRGSLGGNHKTLMIACVSPSESNLEESLNCLRYANRAKNIQNKAVVNVDANSRLIAGLTAQVAALAANLLRLCGDTSPNEDFSRETLQSLAAGAQANDTSSLDGPGKLVAPGNDASALEQRIREIESELDRTREELRQSRSNHDAAEEQLYVASAQRELFRLQLSVLSSDSNSTPSAANQAFVERAAEYEKQIGQLKDALRDAEANLNRLAWSAIPVFDEKNSLEMIEKAFDSVQADRELLKTLESTLSTHETGDGRSDMEDANISLDHEAIAAEEKEEEKALRDLTTLYLEPTWEEDINENRNSSADQHQKSVGPLQKGKSLQADLVELSRSIAAKEELIDQLRLSQEKYASMKDFYEAKLEQMEKTLHETEVEREHLLVALQMARDSNVSSQELENQLRQKEQDIAVLRKRHKELVDLTSVSSNNDSEIRRLQDDVRIMKKAKVDLQKQLNQERKDHATELKKLLKTTAQKEKEVMKWMKISGEREREALRSQQVAKARLEEIGHLKAKYKEAEKKVRMLSFKQGVMAKVGLDPVMVGRRKEKEAEETGKQDGNSKENPSLIDVDQLRDYFDEKVAEVVRKEALADKLAHEWEEHLQLASKQQNDNLSLDTDAAEDLAVKIKFKEDRIRQLASRLGHKPLQETDSKDIINSDLFLYDNNFRRLCSGFSSDSVLDSTAKVLFGMVVRERRRVAALARAASSLDERLQEAEKSAEESKHALCSYTEEQRHEIASLRQSHQEHILSLMDLIKDQTERSQSPHTAEFLGRRTFSSHGSFEPAMLIMAEERIKLLERQVDNLTAEANAGERLRLQIQEIERELISKSRENAHLEEELDDMRNRLRRIGDAVAGFGHGGTNSSTIVEIVNNALHPTPLAKRRSFRNSKLKSGSHSSERHLLSPQSKHIVEMAHASESYSDSGEPPPPWADDVMADLKLIAVGMPPPTLKQLPGVVDKAPVVEKSSVFERLTDPQSFTGTQKVIQFRKKNPTFHPNKAMPHHGTQEERRALSREIEESLSAIVVPDAGVPAEVAPRPGNDRAVKTSNEDNQSSVFDRLISPSHYTGTQKERFQKHRPKKKPAVNDSASRLLDGLLKSDSEANGNDNEQASVRSMVVPLGGAPTNEISRNDANDDAGQINDRSVFDRLISPSHFTGTHRDRFQNIGAKAVAPADSDSRLLDGLLQSDIELPESGCEPVRSVYADYTQQDVRTTTHADAVKQNGPIPPPDHASDASPQSAPLVAVTHDESGRRPQRHENEKEGTQMDYTSVNVFERLQKTTTEAYAKKTMRQLTR